MQRPTSTKDRAHHQEGPQQVFRDPGFDLIEVWGSDSAFLKKMGAIFGFQVSTRDVR